MIDAMNTDFVILSVDITVTNIEITLADGSLPKANQIVEGEELGIKVQLRNLGTKEGIISVTLYEDLGSERTWLAHETQEITIYPGQTTETQIMPFETYKDGDQNIYINISGMDLWLDNTQLPHCVGNGNTATCDLGVETDMPRVVSQDSAESGTTGLIFTISILVILLGAAGVAITVLIRRQNQDQDSIFYEDEDSNQWVDDTYGDQKVTPVLPEDAASQPLATGNETIASGSQTEQTPAGEESAQSDSTVQSTEHPGWIWNQESNEWVADPNYRPPNV